MSDTSLQNIRSDYNFLITRSNIEFTLMSVFIITTIVLGILACTQDDVNFLFGFLGAFGGTVLLFLDSIMLCHKTNELEKILKQFPTQQNVPIKQNSPSH